MCRTASCASATVEYGTSGEVEKRGETCKIETRRLTMWTGLSFCSDRSKEFDDVKLLRADPQAVRAAESHDSRRRDCWVLSLI